MKTQNGRFRVKMKANERINAGFDDLDGAGRS
jgi:hypothetical protein